MRTKSRIPWTWVLACTTAVAACEGTGVEPVLRFGQSGQLVVDVLTPRPFFLASSSGEGELRQSLTWRSNGAWQLYESISYRGDIGSETTTRSPGAPVAYAAPYARVITQINGSPGINGDRRIDLFIEALDPTLDPVCDSVQATSRVTLRVQDEIRRQEVGWTRCSRGPLDALDHRGATPDPDDPFANRVIIVSELIRNGTVGASARSAYHGSVPFATIGKGEKPGDRELTHRVFFGDPGADDEPADWRDFWGWHAGAAPPPDIDWSTDMVVVAGDGARYEAGNTIEIREIEPTRDGAIVKLVEFVPGDFCSPAAVVQTPYHLVVAPRTLTHVQFADLVEERVPCGL